MTRKLQTRAAAVALAAAMSAGAVSAQAPMMKSASTATATTTSHVATAAGLADKMAISKECSDQANAKGLHGQERKKFRSACKHPKT